MLYFMYYYITIYNCYITIRHSLYCITLCLCLCQYGVNTICLTAKVTSFLLKICKSLTVELLYYVVHSSYFLKYPEELNKYANN